MMNLKEQVTKTLDSLSESELQQVAEYLSFLRFRARFSPRQPLDEKELARLYADCASEDRELAEAGMEDYNRNLLTEDKK